MSQPQDPLWVRGAGFCASRLLWGPSFTSWNIPELTHHPGAYPSSQGNCLPSALGNHLWFVAVGTPHSCPLPTAWPNKQACFLLGVGMARLVFLPLHAFTPLHCSRPPQLLTAPACHTLAFCSACRPRGEAWARTSFCSSDPLPTASANTRRVVEDPPGALESERPGSNSPLPWQLCDLWQSILPLYLSFSRCNMRIVSVNPSLPLPRGLSDNEISIASGM